MTPRRGPVFREADVPVPKKWADWRFEYRIGYDAGTRFKKVLSNTRRRNMALHGKTGIPRRVERCAAIRWTSNPHDEETHMTVRAKFTYTGYSASIYNSYPHKKADGAVDHSKPEPVEMRSLKLSPVYANNDPEHENSKFWNSSPSGSIELGTINPGAWSQFELGKSYYIDFTPAET